LISAEIIIFNKLVKKFLFRVYDQRVYSIAGIDKKLRKDERVLFEETKTIPTTDPCRLQSTVLNFTVPLIVDTTELHSALRYAIPKYVI